MPFQKDAPWNGHFIGRVIKRPLKKERSSRSVSVSSLRISGKFKAANKTQYLKCPKINELVKAKD
jgi:hypothetical protein